MTSWKSLAAVAAWACLAPELAHPQPASVPAPAFVVGDNWVFDRTITREAERFVRRRVDLRVNRIDETVMLVRAKSGGTSAPYQDYRVGLD